MRARTYVELVLIHWGIAGAAVLSFPKAGYGLTALGLVVDFGPCLAAWLSLRDTAIRGIAVWGFAVILVSLAAAIAALGEPEPAQMPWTGHLAYLVCLVAMAGLIFPLNARRPGAGAWVILTLLFVAVLLIPWLEGGLLSGGDAVRRLRLRSPWTLFYAVVGVVAVANRLGTRFAGPTVLVGLTLLAEYLSLRPMDGMNDEVRGRIWAAVPWGMGASLAWATRIAVRVGGGPSPLARSWGWFRDLWGLAWGVRVLERFNESAAARGWPIRLTLGGVMDGSSGVPVTEEPEEAYAVLRDILRRFVRPERLDIVAGGGVADAGSAPDHGVRGSA